MSAQSPKAFMMSATLHGVVVALILFFTFAASRRDPPTVPIFELVQGVGDNYLAREAPALGTESGTGVAVDVPKLPPAPDLTPAPAPEPVVEAAPLTPAPPTPAPVMEKAPTKQATKAPTPTNLSKQITKAIIVGESRAKQEAAKERKAEAKRLAEEKKKADQMTKAQFDAQNKNTTKSGSPTKSGSTQVAKVDAKGIAQGVVGGSTNNTKGGAGGKALVANFDNELAAYFAMFKQRVRSAFLPPPGVSDQLKVRIEFYSASTGAIARVRVLESSGNAEFDKAVIAAVQDTTMPKRPDGKSETASFTFSMKEEDSG